MNIVTRKNNQHMYTCVNNIICRRRLRSHRSTRFFHAPTTNPVSLVGHKTLNSGEEENSNPESSSKCALDMTSRTDAGSSLKDSSSIPLRFMRKSTSSTKDFTHFPSLFTRNYEMERPNELLESSLSVLPFLERLEARILQESANLNRAMNLEAKMELEIDYSCLSRRLRSKVYRYVDDYSRFSFLLQQHPLSVPQHVLLQLSSCLPSIDQFERRTLLRRLVYHQNWSEFWSIAFESTPSLTDVEEIADLLREELIATNSVELSIWRALLSANHLISNKRIFRSLCEFIGYRFQIDILVIDEFVSIFNEGIDSKTAERFSDPGQKVAVILAHLGTLQSEEAFGEVVLETLKRHPSIFSVRGLLSELLKISDDGRIYNFVIQRDNLNFNEKDFYHSWQRSNSLALNHSLICHLSRQLKREIRRKVEISDYVKAAMMNQTNNLDLGIATADLFYELLEVGTLVKMIPALLKTSQGKSILRRLLKKSPSVFVGAFKTYFNHKELPFPPVETLQEAESSRSATIINSQSKHALSTAYRGISQENLLWLLKECRYDCPVIFDQALSQLDGSEEIAQKVLSLKITGHKDLVEIWAFLLRNELMDQKACVELFQKVISSALNPTIAATEFTATNSDVDPYIEYFRKSKASDRGRLISVLSNLSHSLSESNPALISNVLNCLTKALFPNLVPIYEATNATRAPVLSPKTEDHATDHKSTILATKFWDSSVSNESAFQDSQFYGSESLSTIDSVDVNALNSLTNTEFKKVSSDSEKKSSKWTDRYTSSFTLFESDVGKSFILRRVIRYTLRYVYDRNPGPEGIRQIGLILNAFKYETQVGQAVVYERIVKLRPQSALEILEKYKNNTSILTPQVLNGMEQGILLADVLTQAQRLRLFEAFLQEKIRLKYTTGISTESFSVAEKLATQSQQSQERQWAFRAKTRRAKPNIKWHSERLSYPCVSDLHLI